MKLLLFTQKMNADDPVLGFFCCWVDELAKHFLDVQVICLEKGRYIPPANVHVFSLGKERGVGKAGYIKNLICFMWQLRNSYDKVFVHMNPEYIVLCGWWWKLTHRDVFLWYIHRSVDLKLRIAVMFAKNIFTSSVQSMSIRSKKILYLGHGIDAEKFVYTPRVYTPGLVRIAYTGRVTRIKNIDVLVDTVSLLNDENISSHLSIFGGTVTVDDELYKQKLVDDIAIRKLSDKIAWNGWTTQGDLVRHFRNIDVSVNLSPVGLMDKTVLESLLLGVPTFVSNDAFAPILGRYADVFMFEYKNSISLAHKIKEYAVSAHSEDVMKIISDRVRKDFDIAVLIQKVVGYIYA